MIFIASRQRPNVLYEVTFEESKDKKNTFCRITKRSYSVGLETIGTGLSSLYHTDRYDKATGMKVALKKALDKVIILEEIQDPKEFRKNFWDAFMGYRYSDNKVV